jgi:hypothetical protein
MLGRLLFGLVKGLLVGGLVGLGLAKLGFAAPAAVVAYLGAAFAGVLIGLVAGKPIWAKDAKIEAGMKAFVGALLAAGLMYAARRFLTMPFPVSLGELGGANTSLGEAASSTGTFGGMAMTSLAAVAALLGGFYEVDNDPSDSEAAPPGSAKKTAETGKRIAAEDLGDADDEELDAEPEKKRAKK